MTGAPLWLTFAGMGLLTYAIRLSMILLLGRLTVTPGLERALRLVPPAVLTAIIVPELLRPNGVLTLTLDNPKLLAGIVAGLVAWRTKNTLATIAAGMVLLWVFQALMN